MRERRKTLARLVPMSTHSSTPSTLAIALKAMISLARGPGPRLAGCSNGSASRAGKRRGARAPRIAFGFAGTIARSRIASCIPSNVRMCAAGLTTEPHSAYLLTATEAAAVGTTGALF